MKKETSTKMLNRRSAILGALVGAFVQSAKGQRNSQKPPVESSVQPSQNLRWVEFSREAYGSEITASVVLALDIRQDIPGKVTALMIKADGREITFTPKELMDALEGK